MVLVGGDGREASLWEDEGPKRHHTRRSALTLRR